MSASAPFENPTGQLIQIADSERHAHATAGQWRRGIHASFLAGWLRTEENNYLGVPPDVACRLPERVQALLGYEMHDAISAGGGTAGYVELRDPMALLREKNP